MVPDCLYYCQGETITDTGFTAHSVTTTDPGFTARSVTITDTGFTARSVTITMSNESHKGRAMEPERSVTFSIGHSNGMQPVARGNLRALMQRGRNCQMTKNQLKIGVSLYTGKQTLTKGKAK
jgi:hypothetical protein